LPAAAGGPDEEELAVGVQAARQAVIASASNGSGRRFITLAI